MISTKNYNSLPDIKSLKNTCKAISVLDAILSQDWEYRYYSYDSKWAKNEEFCGMRNGEGDEMLVLFTENGAVINGFAHEFELEEKSQLTKGLPSEFDEFIFGEPVNSIGTSFCLWTAGLKNWQGGEVVNHDNNSEELLNIFDGNPQTYVDWATEYFEEGFKDTGIPLQTVKAVYEGETLTKDMVLSLVDDLEDWEQLESDLNEINYPYDFG